MDSGTNEYTFSEKNGTDFNWKKHQKGINKKFKSCKRSNITSSV